MPISMRLDKNNILYVLQFIWGSNVGKTSLWLKTIFRIAILHFKHCEALPISKWTMEELYVAGKVDNTSAYSC